MSGKGSSPRPLSVPRAEYDRRWLDTFAPKKRVSRAPGRTRIGNGILRHHPASACEGHACCIHNPSDHPMREFPLHWRIDRGLMERTCPHGVSHPDPDHIAHVRRTFGDDAANTEAVHGCDGCCRQ